MSDVQTDEPISADRFVFAIGDPCPFPFCLDLRRGPLAELGPFEYGMWVFTQDQAHNRSVTVAVGGLERTIEVAADIELVYPDLPCAIRCIAGGAAVRVLFWISRFDLIVAPPGTPWEQAFDADDEMFPNSLAEGKLTLTPQPVDALVECSIRKWGNDDLLTRVTLPATQVIATLRAFLNDLIERAVAAGAIGAAAAAAFLAQADG